MASIFGHVVASTALGYSLFPKNTSWKALFLAGLCSFFPDFDVIAFQFDVPYHSIWGHRGWTHSLIFAFGLGIFTAWLFYRMEEDWWKMAVWFTLATASHPLLDMLTTGGMGCALWWPFSEERLFFPVRVIRVSPLEIRSFISWYGLKILVSETLWVAFPGILMVLAARFFRRKASP